MPRIITNNGYDIGYVEAGGGNATPIVFLHGVGSDKSVWHPQLEHFGRTRRAIAFDYPGYGDSDPAPERQAADVGAVDAEFMHRRNDCGGIIVARGALGGVVAVAMSHHAAERCASLILADTFAAHPNGLAIYERSLEGSRDLPAMAEARVDVLLAQPIDPQIRREVAETMSRIDPAAYRIGAKAVWLADERDHAQEIKVPTLVLVGDHDLITPVDLSSELVDLIPDARMQVIAGAGHLSNLEKPDAFNAIVDQFIDNLN
jgi:3-oxoadipate enol-lactonase